MAGVVAAVMWVLSFILIQLTSLPSVFESFSDYLIEVVLLVGYAGTIGAIVGLYSGTACPAKPQWALRETGSFGLLANLHRVRNSIRGYYR